jgi:sulfatase modifying factor 1
MTDPAPITTFILRPMLTISFRKVQTLFAVGFVSCIYTSSVTATPSLASVLPLPHAVRDAVLILIPAGRTQIGDDTAPPDERPSFTYEGTAFLLDRTPVTVAQFRAFVKETGYVTDAERFGSAGVLDPREGSWIAESGANWRRPFGSAGAPASASHPVTQVSWYDADTFCHAYGARLPTELEWEYAARFGQTPDGHVFKAGEPPRRGIHFDANVWEGLFPLLDSGEDGYRGTSPVGAFGAAPSGLTDMAGNVWQWTASWYLPYGSPTAKPRDLSAERVRRGGSFLCDPTFCEGFRATARGHSTPDTSLINVGFRCAADINSPAPLAGHRARIDEHAHWMSRRLG